MLPVLKTLLASIVDYAGLFPPAKLDLPSAMTNYAKYQTILNSWMLHRFVLPITQIAAFQALLSTGMKPSVESLAESSTQPSTQPDWQLSLLIPPQAAQDWPSTLSQVITPLGLNAPQVTIAALEFPPLAPTEIEALLPLLPEGIIAYFELPYCQDLNPYLLALKAAQGCAKLGVAAKIRTGGITADAFPDAAQLSQILFAFAAAGVPFKATAGLHHALPGVYRLAYEPDSPTAPMQGFLTTAILAAFIHAQAIEISEAPALLQTSDAHELTFADREIIWQQRHLSLDEIAAARQYFFHGFGSCSFQEPIDDLHQLHLL